MCLSGPHTMSEKAVIRIFVFREGLLSVLVNDLRISFERFTLDVTDGHLRGHFDISSLRVDGAVKRGLFDPEGVSQSDAKKVARIVTQDVLRTDRYPEATLEAELFAAEQQAEVRGTLTLLGQRRAIPDAKVVLVGDRLVAGLAIQPSRWGIKPYRSLGGALRIKDQINIEIAVPTSRGLDLAAERSWDATG